MVYPCYLKVCFMPPRFYERLNNSTYFNWKKSEEDFCFHKMVIVYLLYINVALLLEQGWSGEQKPVLLSLLQRGPQNDVTVIFLTKFFFFSILPNFPSLCLPLPCQPQLSPYHSKDILIHFSMVMSWPPEGLNFFHHRNYFSKSCLWLTNLGS